MQELLDKLAIQEVVLRYCRGVDRLDAELLASAYHPDAVDEHGRSTFEGEAIAPGILGLVRSSKISLHQVTNQSVTLDGDRAAAETYFTAWQTVEQDGEDRLLQALGRYVDRFERRDGTWRISYRKVIVEATRILPTDGTMLATEGPGRRDRDDPSYSVLTGHSSASTHQ